MFVRFSEGFVVELSALEEYPQPFFRGDHLKGFV